LSPLIVAIDGPSGAGKSTVARALAARLGLPYIDTGAMYRAMTFAALQRGVPEGDLAEVAAMAPMVRIDIDDDTVVVDERRAQLEVDDVRRAMQPLRGPERVAVEAMGDHEVIANAD